MNPEQFRVHVLRPALASLPARFRGLDAEELLIATAAHETHLGYYLVQINGPALGLYGMEPATYEDLFRNSSLATGAGLVHSEATLLVTDLIYATQCARVQYFRFHAALPKATDLTAIAQYWKKYWNTPKGKGTIDEFKTNYNLFAGGIAL